MSLIQRLLVVWTLVHLTAFLVALYVAIFTHDVTAQNLAAAEAVLALIGGGLAAMALIE